MHEVTKVALRRKTCEYSMCLLCEGFFDVDFGLFLGYRLLSRGCNADLHPDWQTFSHTKFSACPHLQSQDTGMLCSKPCTVDIDFCLGSAMQIYMVCLYPNWQIVPKQICFSEFPPSIARYGDVVFKALYVPIQPLLRPKSCIRVMQVNKRGEQVLGCHHK